MNHDGIAFLLMEAANRSKDMDTYRVRKILSSMNAKYAWSKNTPPYSSSRSHYTKSKLVVSSKLSLPEFLSCLLREGFDRCDNQTEEGILEVSSTVRLDSDSKIRHRTYISLKPDPSGLLVSTVCLTGMSFLSSNSYSEY